ncbi:MAG TPA: methylenetetrahydrofolate reductase [Firmicutes bacterium]|nr:methylenetetrahydrofolate reductase [Bacillota bacterium]
MEAASNLEYVLKTGQFAVTAEIGAPKGASGQEIRRRALLLHDCTDAQNLTDNQTAVVRLCSLAAAVHVLEAGGEPVLQVTTRDRNRIALQSDLLGALSLGVRNVLCMTGDHPRLGNHPEARGVFDLDSIQLLAVYRRMREEGRFLCGEEIKPSPRPFFLGAVENPFSGPLSYRLARLAKKIRAGAEFIQTQIVFDLPAFERWMSAVREGGLHHQAFLLAGICPPKSAAMLRYMRTLPGISVPEELLRRMEQAQDQAREGKLIALELIRRVREIEGVRGVHLMAVRWEEVVPELVAEAELMPRPRWAAEAG